jgi:hypothetical protein
VRLALQMMFVVIERNTPLEVTTYKVLNGITAGV